MVDRTRSSGRPLRRRRVGVGLLVLACSGGAAAAQGRPGVMILSMYHMANPGADDTNVRADSVTSPSRQAQLEALAESLAAFSPTHIAVELTPSRAPDLASWYAEYRAGGLRSVPTSELDQVAFRLARRLGLERLYPVDHGGDFDVQALARYAGEHGQGDRIDLARAITARAAAEIERIQKAGTVTDILRYLNSTAFDSVHGFYMTLAAVGTDSVYPGAEAVAAWYERNLKIFANIRRLAVEPGARVLVLIGAGHGTLLRRFVADAPDLDLVPAEDYLP